MTVEDHGGQLLVMIVAADVAESLAQPICGVRPEPRGKGFSILVTDAEGKEVHRALVERFTLV
jgi:hypothetical protein